MRVSVLVVAALLCTVAGCSGSELDEASAPSVAPVLPRTEPSNTTVATFAPLACGTPADSLVRRLLDVVAVGDGSVTASTLVPAVTTATGDWYIVGLDQDTQIGDSTVYPDRSVRALAVTDANARHAKIIRLGNANSSNGNISWRRVNWTDETLALGQQAAAKAVSCLDANR